MGTSKQPPTKSSVADSKSKAAPAKKNIVINLEDIKLPSSTPEKTKPSVPDDDIPLPSTKPQGKSITFIIYSVIFVQASFFFSHELASEISQLILVGLGLFLSEEIPTKKYKFQSCLEVQYFGYDKYYGILTFQEQRKMMMYSWLTQK